VRHDDTEPTWIATDPEAFEAFYRRHIEMVTRFVARRVRSVMAGLPKSERAVVELVVIDELSVGEAAAVLGIRQGTARVRLHRARRSLRGDPDLGLAVAVEGL